MVIMNGNCKREEKCNRRRFLKATAAVSVSLALNPSIGQAKEAVNTLSANEAKTDGLPHRTLGSGKAAFEVSALGFGVMGRTYNRSQHPDKKQCIRLLREAMDKGVTLFDTAIIYGPLNNEELAGEALGEFRGKVIVNIIDESRCQLFYLFRMSRLYFREKLVATISGSLEYAGAIV